MFSWIKQAVGGIRVVLKYGSLAIVILRILGFTADELEKWESENKALDKQEKKVVDK